MKKCEILDVTLRDGSYAVNFQFSCAEQTEIGKELAECGVKYLEIGHGMGLGASTPKNGMALHTDLEYLSEAKKNFDNINYGVFCIPGVARLQDIEMAVNEGISFIRIGSNSTEIEQSKDYIEYAKKCGLFVMANYMKSYTMKADEFAENVKKSERYGADCVYVVDSSGSMQPDQILAYYEAIRKVSDIKIGFHGHDNLGTALWNSMAAAEAGFDFIDCSLCGLGRSAGNTQLDLFAINAMKKGLIDEIDVKRIIKFSEKRIVPLTLGRKMRYIDIICGMEEFHTSNLKYIHKVAGKYGVSPIELIESYSKIDKINIDLAVLEKVAQSLNKNNKNSVTGLETWNYFEGV